MSYTYHEIKGTLDGYTETLYGSYEKSDCRYELEAEGESWADEGYRKIRIVSRETETAPDAEVYGYAGRFFIVNDFDRPESRAIAEKCKDGFYYIHPELRDQKLYWGMSGNNATPIEDFGFELAIDDEMEIPALVGRLTGPSKAKYSDGQKREWQGAKQFRIELPDEK